MEFTPRFCCSHGTAHLGLRAKALLLYQALLVGRDEPLLERQAQPRDGPERPYPEALFLEEVDEALGDPGSLRCLEEGRTGRDPEEPEFGLEIVAHSYGPPRRKSCWVSPPA